MVAKDGSRVELCKILFITMAPQRFSLSHHHGDRGYIIEKEVSRTSKQNAIYFYTKKWIVFAISDVITLQKV